jgi:hypothetical protein
MLRGAKHHEDLRFANTPADLVEAFASFWLLMVPDLTEAKLDALLQPQCAAR